MPIVLRGIDDEVLAEGARYHLAWTPLTGWRVTGCERAFRRRD